jgi:hypothetical protein
LLTEPQSVTIGANTRTLVKTESDRTRSVFTDRANGIRLEVSQANGARRRSLVKLTITKIAADPITAVNNEISMTVHAVIDSPRVGFTDVEIKDGLLGLTTWHTATSAANSVKVIGGEY